MKEDETSMSLQRQAYLVVGVLVLLSVLLGAFVSKWWLLIAFGVSLGLLNAARTGICQMTIILSKLPFNRSSAGTIS